MTKGLRHGIVTASTKRMAATEPAHGKDQPFRGSISLKSFNRIRRAAREKSTGSREKGRQYNLVASYQENQNPAHLLCREEMLQTISSLNEFLLQR